MHFPRRHLNGHRFGFLHPLGLAIVFCLGSFLTLSVSASEFVMRLVTTTIGTDTTVVFDLPAFNYSFYDSSPKEEYGMEIILPPGTPRVLKTLGFDYFSNFEAPNSMVVRVYMNDGPMVEGVASPGSFLYEFYYDLEGTTGGQIVHVADGFGFLAADTVPDRLTVTMEILGLSGDRHAGWALSEAAATTGTVANPKFWHTLDEANTWSLVSLTDSGGPTNSPVLAGPITNSFNGHSYYLLAEDSWQNSEAQAKKLGGHLVTLNDVTEQEWVFSTFGGYGGVQRSLWIGYQRAVAGGAFSWVSGETSDYTHWADHEPDNLGGTENYAHLFRSGNAFGQPAGSWNDLASPKAGLATYGPLCGVVEVQPVGPPLTPVLTVNPKSNQACWTAVAGRGYQVQIAVDPSGPWINSGAPIVGAGSQCASLELSSGLARRYLRVVVNP